MNSTAVAVISLPISVQVSKTKKFPINLNHYRNTHFQTLNKAKKDFKDSIGNVLRTLPFFQQIKLVYRIYPSSKQSVDVANVCSVADKFFSDALVEYGKILDDNFKVVRKVEYEYGGVDKDNPRIEVEIHDLTLIPENPTPKSERHFNMQIVFQEDEILAALQSYVTKIMHLNPDVRPSISLVPTDDGSVHATMEVTVAGIVPASSGSLKREATPATPAPTIPAATASAGGTRAAVSEALGEGRKRTASLTKPKAVEAPVPAAEPVETPAEPISEQTATKQATSEVISLLKTQPDTGDKPVPAPSSVPAAVAPAAAKPSIFSKTAAPEPRDNISTGDVRIDPNNPENLPVVETEAEQDQKQEPVMDNVGGAGGVAVASEGEDNQETELPENPSTAPESANGTTPVQPAEKPRPTLGISIGVKKSEPSPAAAEPEAAATGLGGSIPSPDPKPSLFNFKKPF